LFLLDHSVWIAMLCGWRSSVLGETTICIIAILTKWFSSTRLEGGATPPQSLAIGPGEDGGHIIRFLNRSGNTPGSRSSVRGSFDRIAGNLPAPSHDQMLEAILSTGLPFHVPGL
jgi:hypothetical protein